MFGTVVKAILALVFLCMKWLVYLLIPFCIMCVVFFLYYTAKGKRLPKRVKPSTYKQRNILLRLFWDFPKRFVLDRFEADPDKFPIDGLHLFAGEQGSGKSIASVEFCMRMKKLYPNCRIRSNIDVSFQDEKLEGWEQIVFDSNGTFGDISYIDEIQNWFNSADSKSFPPEMIQEICQLRKQIKVIVGTSQVFARVAKPIREQVRVLYKPITIAGCLTIVRCYKPMIKQDGTIDKLRRIKTYFFVHNEELRNAYDTYEKVQRLATTGFKPMSERLGAENSDELSVKAPRK
ncbi:MAG: hypothetical protein IK999_10655 [Ruminococcus sp.]|nr:hypothetical protein [Ruminococcus sp.]